ncbi:MAG TPA: hypothetical protein VLJ76_01585 [Gaiellaceae bacterium]|nr:hypothetical protein [Gaiellaceae bacterium]
MPVWGWILIGIAAAIVIGVVIAVPTVRTRRLKGRFGSEYDRTVEDADSRRAAEADLRDRERRRQELDIRPLQPEARESYLEQWRSTQESFVDDPRGAVIEADNLVLSVMRARGYPVDDFDRRADDISVDYPDLVGNFRAAHAIAQRQSSGTVTTEELRQAMRHYRALFDELLEADVAERVRVH